MTPCITRLKKAAQQLHDNAMTTAHHFCPSALGRAHIHSDFYSYPLSVTWEMDIQNFKDSWKQICSKKLMFKSRIRYDMDPLFIFMFKV